MRKKSTKLLSLIIAMFMVMALVPFSALSVSAGEAEVTEVSTFAELVAAVNADKTNIKLKNDIKHTVPMELPEQHRLIFDGNAEYTLDLGGFRLYVVNSENEYYSGSISFIKVAGSSKLNIKNGAIVFQNGKAKSREDYGCVQVTDTATLITERVDINARNSGGAVILENSASATLNDGLIKAFDGYAVYAKGSSNLTLDYGVTLRTEVGDGYPTISYFGYGSLYFASTGDLTVSNAYFTSGVQVHKSQIDEFDIAKKEVSIDGTVLTQKIFGEEYSMPSEYSPYDYYWYRGNPTYCILMSTKIGHTVYSYDVKVVDTSKKFPITVTNGVAKIGGENVTEACYGETVTLVANSPKSGYVFTYWEGVDVGNYESTTTFKMPYAAVEVAATYGKEPISNIAVTVTAPEKGQKVSEHVLTLSENVSENGTISWTEQVDEDGFLYLTENDIFLPGKTYVVHIGIKANAGSTFADEGAITATVNGGAASVTKYGNGNVVLHYKFDALSTSQYNVSIVDNVSMVGLSETITLDTEKMCNESDIFKEGYEADKVTYQWYQNGEAIEGATEESYKIESAVDGDKFVAKVTVTKRVDRVPMKIVSYSKSLTYTNSLIGEIILDVDDPKAGQKLSELLPTLVTTGFEIVEDSIAWERFIDPYSCALIQNNQVIFEAGETYRVSLRISRTSDAITLSNFTAEANGRKTSTISYSTEGVIWITFATVAEDPFSIIMTADSDVGQGDILALDIEAMKTASAEFKTAYEAGKVTYQWYADGVAIDGATLPKLKLENKYGNQAVYVEVTADGEKAYKNFMCRDYITSLDFQVPLPIAGQTPSETIIEKNGKVELKTIFWSKDGLTTTAPFVEGEEYSLELYFAPAEGYTFDYESIKENTTINGVPAVANFLDASNGSIIIEDILFTALPPHTHTYGDSFNGHDDENHWKECTDTACPDKFGSIKDKVEHTFSADFKTDAENHWKECTCGAKTENGAHSGGTATCTAKAKCEICNADYGSVATHTHGTEFKTDADNHWNECACGDKANVAPHADTNNDEKCDVCSYAMPKAEENDPSAPTPDLPDTNTDKPTDATEGEKDDETEAPADKGCGGCGSSAALSALAIVAVVGSALVIKKKKD